jgi:hypothetical protein
LAVEIPSEAEIGAAAETIFDLIIDFRGQGRWLARSSAFHGTEEISSNPVALGTTYREPRSRQGRDRPTFGASSRSRSPGP